MKRVIVAGSRGFNDKSFAYRVLDALYSEEPIEVVSGGAAGADWIGESWSKDRQGLNPTVMRPEYDKYPKRQAPIIRNADMAEYAIANGGESGLVLLWDGRSSGSKNMLENAYRAGITEIHIYRRKK